MLYFSFEIPGWLNTQVACGATEEEAISNAEALPDFANARQWRQITEKEDHEIQETW